MENYPIFENHCLKINDEYIINKNFNKYINWTHTNMNNIQFNSSTKSEIPLTFYPIAKNIRLTSSHMAQNILNNKNSFIDNYARTGEPHFWENQVNRGKWYPWLWARTRIEGDYKNIHGWSLYFDSFTNNQKNTFIDNKDILEPPNDLILFFTYLSCLKYTFQLNNKYNNIMQNYIINMNFPINSNILAVQIRRGETCTKDGMKTDRPYFSINNYIDKIQLMLDNNNFEYIYISTDSNEEIEKIKELRPEWKLIYLPIERNNFFRMDENAKPQINGFNGIAQDLEDCCRLHPDKIPFIVDSALADLYFISLCKGYISTINQSEFSRLGWFLQIATHNKMLPYINMNDEIINMNESGKLLML